MIREVHIAGFKSIVDQTVRLGRVNCFIGANGVGKSNVLEAIGVLGAAASGRVDDEAMGRRGVRAGLPRLFKTSFANARIPPHIGITAQGQPSASYQVSLLNPLASPEPAWAFKTETLVSALKVLVSRGVRGRKANLAASAGLAALEVVALPEDDAASTLLRTLQTYAIYCPNTPALRATVSDPQTRSPVGLAGGALAEGFAALKRTCDDESLDEVLELIDWASDVSVTESAGALLSPSVPRAKHVLKFTDRFMAGNRNTLTAYDASEGALYVLFAAVLCLSASSPPFFAIDNLDQVLNPRLLSRLVSRLAGWLERANPERQLLFTAHNPAVLDGLDLADPEVRLFAVERNSEGHTRLRRVEVSAELRQLSETHPLSRLWMMGRLGAVPNV